MALISWTACNSCTCGLPKNNVATGLVIEAPSTTIYLQNLFLKPFFCPSDNCKNSVSLFPRQNLLPSSLESNCTTSSTLEGLTGTSAKNGQCHWAISEPPTLRVQVHCGNIWRQNEIRGVKSGGRNCGL